MLWIFALVGLILVVLIGLLVLGRETARLAGAARTAVFDLAEATDYIADRLPEATQARISTDDVRWVLLADADLLEDSTGAAVLDAVDPTVVDEDAAVAAILARADGSGRDLEDGDVVAVLDGRSEYLRAIGAVGPEATEAE